MSFSARSTNRDTAVGGKAGLKPLERRVPTNKKYENIKSTLDTGASVSKVQYVSQGQFIKRASEIFFRVSPSDMYAMYAEYERAADENLAPAGYAHGSGGPRIVVHEEEKTAEAYEQPYLVLDLRPETDFAACHLLQARSFPQRLLMQDKSTVELHRFRNRDGKLIVLYDDDERLATAAAQQLVHRGFENVFVLSGGLVVFAERFPSCVEGTPPSPRSPGGGDSPRGGRGSTARSQRSGVASRAGSSSSSNSSALVPRGGGGPRAPPDTARSSASSMAPSANPLRSARTGAPSTSASSRVGGLSARGPRAPPGGARLRTGAPSRVDEADETASRMSELSVADSVISRARARKPNYY